MPILLNDNLFIPVNKPTDSRYGPHVDVAAAKAGIALTDRYLGLTIGVGNPITEYWWKDGVGDNSLIEKIPDNVNTLTTLTVDNLTLDDNTISSTTGNIEINPSSDSLTINGDVLIQKIPIVAGETRKLTLTGARNSDNIGNYAAIEFGNYDSNTPNTTVLNYIGASISASCQADDDGGGQLIFSTANITTLAEAMRIDHTGNVGIGLALPTTTLEVNGNFKVDNIKIDANTISSTDTNGNIILDPNGTGKVEISTNASSYTLPDEDGTAGQAIIANGDGTTSFQDISTTLSIAADNPTTSTINLLDDSITISGGSNITTSVDAYGEVDVSLDANITGLTSLDVDNLTLDGNTISSTTGDIILNPPANSKVVVLDSDLILKTTPLTYGESRTITLLGERNAVNTTAYAIINLSNFDSNFNGGTEYVGASIQAFLPEFEAQGGGHLTFSTANGNTLAEAMRIDHTGNVGIKTPSPSFNLHVNGTAKVNESLTISDYTLPVEDGTAGQAIITDGQGTTSFQDISTTLSIVADGSNSTINLLDDSITISGGSNITTSVDAYGEVDVSLDANINVTTMTASGDIEVTTAGAAGIILKSPDGSRWRLTVDNTGNLVTTEIT